MDLAGQLAEALRRRRRDAGLTQVQAARRLGLSQPTLNRLESEGQNTTLKTLNQLCRALRCGIGTLFAGRFTLRRGGHHQETRRRAQHSARGKSRR